MGQVCIFNSVGAVVRFTINGGITPPVETTSSSENFVPQSLWVEMKKRIDIGVFGYGRDKFSVSFNDIDERFGEKNKYAYVIDLSPQATSLLDDLVIYVFRQLIVVMKKNGYIILEVEA